jgi:hypothetical protein
MRQFTVVLTIAILVSLSLSLAQTEAPTGQKTLAATMSVYVFPKQGQDKQQQSEDEAACYGWAVGQTGTDPFELAKRVEQTRQQAQATKDQARQAGEGAGAKGAVRGAAVGALIGEIADDDPGEGAAYGAAAGLLRGRRAARRGQQRAAAQADRQVEQAQQATAAQIEEFKKAFSVCLEAKDYLVKY